MEAIISLLSLIALEIILGIDNIIFISILSEKLPASQRDKIRYLGLALALLMRLLLLTVISWILKLNHTLFTIDTFAITGKGIILISGGIFLLYKSTKEIYHKTEEKETIVETPKKISFSRILLEIIVLDLVFSIDSIITAVGMVDQLWIMYTAVVVTVIIMLFASKPISTFIHKHPSFKILGLCFLMMIGVSLIAEGLHFSIPKAYIYGSMAFAFFVDIMQMRNLKN